MVELQSNGKMIGELTDELATAKLALSEIRQELDITHDVIEQKDAFIQEIQSALKDAQSEAQRYICSKILTSMK